MKVIYGDGTHEAAVGDGLVVISETAEGGATQTVAMSEAAFREVVIGWQRHLDVKTEK
jgi:hypothetical protein